MVSVICRKMIASLLVCALLAPSLALADDNQTTNKPSRKGAIALLAAGIGLAAVGAWGLTQSNSNSCNGQWGSDGSGMGVACTPIPSLNRNSRAWGGISVGVGVTMTVGGIIMLSRRKKPAAPADQSPPSENATSRPTSADRR